MSVRIIVDDMSKPIANYPNKLHKVLNIVEEVISELQYPSDLIDERTRRPYNQKILECLRNIQYSIQDIINSPVELIVKQSKNNNNNDDHDESKSPQEIIENVIDSDASETRSFIKMQEEKLRLLQGLKGDKMDEVAGRIVRDYIVTHLDKSDVIPHFKLYIVWKAKILQNWKYLISSTLIDGMYYELTYNGDKEEWYLDAYKKFENQLITKSNLKSK